MSSPIEPTPEGQFVAPASPPPPPAQQQQQQQQQPAAQALGSAQAPGYGQAPGYHQAPGYQGQPAPGYGMPLAPQPAPPRGLLPWVLGFLIFVPFPFAGGIASGIAMAVSGGGSRRAGGIARENARSALNWGLTYLLVSTSLLVMHFVLLFMLTAESSVSSFYPLGIPITLYFAISVVHVVLVIMGTVRASSGKVMRVPFAIPFVRA